MAAHLYFSPVLIFCYAPCTIRVIPQSFRNVLAEVRNCSATFSQKYAIFPQPFRNLYEEMVSAPHSWLSKQLCIVGVNRCDATEQLNNNSFVCFPHPIPLNHCFAVILL